MSRSAWKVPFVCPLVFSKCFLSRESFNLYCRNLFISSFFQGKKFFVHNGIWLKSVVITNNMVGFKLGEFIQTKKTGRSIHFKNKK